MGRAPFSRRYTRAGSRRRAPAAEVTPITGRVDSALTVPEDGDRACVRRSTLEQLRVRFWTRSLKREISLGRDTCTAPYDEAVATGSAWVEASIVLLIVLELLLASLFS